MRNHLLRNLLGSQRIYNQFGRNISSQSIFMLMMKVKFAVDRGDTNYIFPTAANGSVILGMSQIIPTSQ